MKSKIALFFALGVIAGGGMLVSSAQSQSAMQTIHQKNFYGDSTGAFVNHSPASGCPRIPRNCDVSLDGGDALPILVNPWETVSINIVCAQVIFMPSGAVSPSTMFFAGNSYSPDVMAWGVARPGGGGSAKMCYPAGTSFPFPPALAGAPKNAPGQNNFLLPHLDVHVQGMPKTVNYTVYLSVWYTKNPRTP